MGSHWGRAGNCPGRHRSCVARPYDPARVDAVRCVPAVDWISRPVHGFHAAPIGRHARSAVDLRGADGSTGDPVLPSLRRWIRDSSAVTVDRNWIYFPRYFGHCSSDRRVESARPRLAHRPWPDCGAGRAVQTLPPQFREVVYYADVEGFRYQEIAAMMWSARGTVMSRLHRGRSPLMPADPPCSPVQRHGHRSVRADSDAGRRKHKHASKTSGGRRAL